MDLKEQARELHRKNRGKIEMRSKVPVETREDLSLAYTPGEMCIRDRLCTMRFIS